MQNSGYYIEMLHLKLASKMKENMNSYKWILGVFAALMLSTTVFASDLVGLYEVSAVEKQGYKAMQINETTQAPEMLYVSEKPVFGMEDFESFQKIATPYGFSLIEGRFKKEAADRFTVWTESLARKRMGIVLDGRLVMAPTMAGKIDSGRIQMGLGMKPEQIDAILQKIPAEMVKQSAAV